MVDRQFIALLRSESRRQLLSLDLYRPRPASTLARTRDILAAALGRRPDRERYAFFWTTAILAWGVAWSHRAFGDRADRAALESFFSRHLDRGSIAGRLRSLDDAMHGYPLLHLYASTGAGRYERALHQTADFLMKKLRKSPRGAIPYRESRPDVLFVDSIGMICPFLAHYGRLFSAPEATAAAVLQMTEFLRRGLDSASKLPYHAYREGDAEQLGLSGWGRGTGWLAIGMVDALEHIPADHPDHFGLVAGLRAVLDAAAGRQDGTGAFRWHLTDPTARTDTSATAMIGYAIARAVSLGYLEAAATTRARRCLDVVRAATAEDGAVGGASGECGGLGRYSQEFGSYPWAQGPALALASALADRAPGSAAAADA